MALNPTDSSQKTLANLEGTSDTKRLVEEQGSDTINVYGPDVWTDIVDSDPSVAVGLGAVTQETLLTMVEENSVGNQETWRAGAFKDFVSTKFGPLYEAQFYDGNDALITKASQIAQGFKFNYQTAILTIDGNAGAFVQPFKITAHRYIGLKGDFSGGGGGATIPVDEDDIRGGYRTVPDITARDLVPANRREEGMLVFTQLESLLWRLNPDLLTWSSANGTISVVDVVARDAIAAGARFDGMLIESQASFITWRLRADLTTWDAVANNSPDFLTFDPVLTVFDIFARVHNVYVETTGDDAAGEGTAANPYASIQAALDSVPGQKAAVIQVRLGLGTFTVGAVVVRDATSAVALIGTVVVVESLAVPTGAVVVPGKRSQLRNTYAVAPSTTIVNGTHFYDSDFGLTGLPEFFRAKRVLLDTSAGSDLDMVALSSSFAGDIVTNGTTLTATGELNFFFQDAAQSDIFGLSNNKIMGCNLVAPGNLNVKGCYVDGCFVDPVSTFRLGTDGGAGTPRTTVFNSVMTAPNIFAQGDWQIRVSLVLSGTVFVSFRGELSNTTLVVAGTQVVVAGNTGSIGPAAQYSLAIGGNDHENATLCYDVVNGSLVSFFTSSIVNCAKFARVSGLFSILSAAAVVDGVATGDAIEVLPGGKVKGVANLVGNLTATGNELVVGGTGRTFATAPHTDIGELSQVLP